MGLFDLDEYLQKKTRADESATPPREFPVAFADVMFNGRRQKLLFEPVLLDGGHVFISFRPEDAPDEKALFCGGGSESGRKFYAFLEYNFPHILRLRSDEALDFKEWIGLAIAAVEAEKFGRLTVDEHMGKFVYNFWGSSGNWDEDDYRISLDGAEYYRTAQESIDFDWSSERKYWAKEEDAVPLLVQLDASEFARHLERQKGLPHSAYGLSCNWPNMSHAERLSHLPEWEKQHGETITNLMRAIILSDPRIGQGETLREPETYGKPFWRRARLWNRMNRNKGDVQCLAEHLVHRASRLWPHITTHFLPLLRKEKRSYLHPIVRSWMNYRGGYIVQFEQPNAHEHLEARLLLKDFLEQKGVSLDKIDEELRTMNRVDR